MLFKPGGGIAIGDKVQILAGPCAGQCGIIKELDIPSVPDLGRLCAIELSSGRAKGAAVTCFSYQIRNLSDQGAYMQHRNISRCDNCGRLYDYNTGDIIDGQGLSDGGVMVSDTADESDHYFCSLDCVLKFLGEPKPQEVGLAS